MKTKKNEEYKDSEMSIFGFTFFIKNYILLKNSSKRYKSKK